MRIRHILLVTACLLLIPLVAMQFTPEVDWTLFDFMLAAALLILTGMGIRAILHSVKNTQIRRWGVVLLVLLLVLVWMELAVGLISD